MVRWKVTLERDRVPVLYRVHNNEADARADFRAQAHVLDIDHDYWAGYRVTLEEQTWQA